VTRIKGCLFLFLFLSIAATQVTWFFFLLVCYTNPPMILVFGLLSRHTASTQITSGTQGGFLLLVCYAATPPALQLHQQHIQVVRGSKEARKRLARIEQHSRK